MVKRRIAKIVCSCPQQYEVDREQLEIAEEKKEYKSILSYENSINKLNTFAKWLFASSSIVGILAAGFSIANYSNIVGWGVKTYGISIVLITISLVIVTFSLKPIGDDVGKNNLDSQKRFIENSLIKSRGRLLKVAAWFFAISIIAAGVTPFASKLAIVKSLPEISINHEFMPNNFSKILINGQNLSSKNVNISIEKFQNKLKTTYYSISIKPDSKGSIKKDLIIEKDSNLFPFDSLLIKCKWSINDTSGIYKYLINSI